ncbi:MAG: hypothetical protein OES12_07245, partial [Anaerolineae bacterium]|nr:hypothetical protein [Anaerolineae bacterium]
MQHHLRSRSVILVILSFVIPVSLVQLAEEAAYAEARSDRRFWPDPSAAHTAQDSTANFAAIDSNYTASQISATEVNTLTVQIFLPWVMVNP